MFCPARNLTAKQKMLLQAFDGELSKHDQDELIKSLGGVPKDSSEYSLSARTNCL